MGGDGVGSGDFGFCGGELEVSDRRAAGGAVGAANGSTWPCSGDGKCAWDSAIQGCKLTTMLARQSKQMPIGNLLWPFHICW